MRSDARALTLRSVLVALLATVVGTGVAQDRPAPFAEDPLAISAAFGAEMSVVRLTAASELLAGDVDEDDVEEVLEALELEEMRYAWALGHLDADLAEELDEALETIEESDDPDDAIEAARPLAERARDTLIGPEMSEPAFAAAMGALLLTSATGVGEGFEEGVEGEAGAYAMGWVGLQRVKAYWATLEPDATEEQRFEVEDQLAELDGLFPGPVPPDFLERSDPEEAEGAAYRIAGYFEDASGALVFPDRDLAELYVATRDVAREGCTAYDAGERARGDAHLAWTAFAFDQYLTGTLSMFAPEPMEIVSETLLELVPREIEEEGPEAEEEEEEDDEDEVEAERPELDEAAELCVPLLDALDEAGAALGV